jgi:hypothetical protein
MSNFLHGQGLFRSIAKLDRRQAGAFMPRVKIPPMAGQCDAEIAEKGHLWMETNQIPGQQQDIGLHPPKRDDKASALNIS